MTVPARTAEKSDIAACRELLRHGSRTFFAASYLLPRRVRDPATALYAFCRLADDAVDASGDAAAAIGELRERLAGAYAGRPLPIAADRAFAAVVRRYRIPATVPEALLEGFAWDAAGRRYRTPEDLHAYAARVAGTVGVMMALLMGARTESLLARACDLGVAMQLSNIARDVGEDARMGRIYLPLAWLEEAGIDPDAWLAAPRHTPALGSVIRRVLDEADRLYRHANAGIAGLPLSCRPGIYAARYLYAAIGHQVREQRLDSVSRRAVVPAGRKLGWLTRAMLATGRGAAGADAPPLAATAFLVRAAATGAPPSATPRGVRGWGMWLIELFEQLERRDRAHSGPAVRRLSPEASGGEAR